MLAAAPTPGSKTGIRWGKDTGLSRFPSHSFAINTAWLTAVMFAADLLALNQTVLLTGELAQPNRRPCATGCCTSRARLTRGGRRPRLRLDQAWRWTTHLAAAFTRMHGLPQPIR
jgi:hypothetical protein